MKRFFALFMAIIVIFNIVSQVSAASEVFCTVLNDRILDITDSTMPIRKNGQIYVPYTLFGNEMGIKSSRNKEKETLVLYNIDYTLTYELISGNSYDEKLNTYSYPAVYHNETIYVSMSQVANKFNIYASLISYKTPIVRISKASPSLSDKSFLSIASKLIDDITLNYYKANDDIIIPQPPINSNSDSTQKKPSKLYLTFDGVLSDRTSIIVKNLSNNNIPATFFIKPDDFEKNDDIIREIFARGHRIGIFLTNEKNALLDAKKANDALDEIIGTKTRIVKLDGFISPQLESAGYISWKSNFSPTSFESAKKKLSQKSAGLVMSLPANNNNLASKIISQIRVSEIYTSSIYDSDSPL